MVLGEPRVKPVLLLEANVARHVFLEIAESPLVLLPVEVDEPQVVSEVVALGLALVDEEELLAGPFVVPLGEVRDAQVEGNVEIVGIEPPGLLELPDRPVHPVQGQGGDSDEVVGLRTAGVEAQGLEEVLEGLGVVLRVVGEDPAVNVHVRGLGGARLGGRPGGARKADARHEKGREESALGDSHGAQSSANSSRQVPSSTTWGCSVFSSTNVSRTSTSI